jgi:molybdopterin-binding protein
VIVDVGEDVAVMITRESLERLHVEPSARVWVSFKASSLDIKDT